MTSENISSIIDRTLEMRRKRARLREYADDPVLWAQEYLGVQLWSKQKEIAYSVRDNRGTAVAAGHGVGKTYVSAIICAWWIDTHPLHEVFVASTAPSKDQVDLLWDELRKVHAMAEQRFQDGLIDHPLPGYIRGDNQWVLKDGTRIGQGRKPPDNKADVAFQGRHAKYLLAIGDEAVGIPEGFLDALNNIATGRYNRRLLQANPTDPSCAMAKHWERAKKREAGEDVGGEGWNLMHISVFDSPTVTGESGFDVERAAGMSGWEYINERKVEWGEDDPRYVSRVLGQWAWDQGNMVFSEQDLGTAKDTCVIVDDLAPIRFGVDVARSPKGDYTVIYSCQEGDVWFTDGVTGKPTEPAGWRGEKVRFVDRWRGAPLTGTNEENLGSDQRIDRHANEHGAVIINIDAAGGYGQGVKDGLDEIGNPQYVTIEVFGGSTEVDRRQYTNLRSFNYFELKRKMNARRLDIDPADEVLLEEYRGIRYEHDSVGRIKIESKDDMKKRNVKSPDNADATWYAAMDINGALLTGMVPGAILVVDEDIYAQEYGEFYFKSGRIGW